MTPWSSPTSNERIGSTHDNPDWHGSHNSYDITIRAPLEADFQRFGTCTTVSQHRSFDQHKLTSQYPSRPSTMIVNAYHGSSLASQHAHYAHSSSSQHPYLSGSAPFVPSGTWNEAPTGGYQEFLFQSPNTYHPTSLLHLTHNLSPDHGNGPLLPPTNPPTSYQHVPHDFTRNLDQQLPRGTAPGWQVHSAGTSTPGFVHHRLLTPPPPIPHPHMVPNSGGGTPGDSSPCLWGERGVFCNNTVRATRAWMNHHLRTYHGFSGPETRLTRCQWVGCGKSMQQGSIARHLVTCHLQAKVTCPRCLKQLSRADVMPKHQRVCPAANR